jgi:uncharacterized repeat protein (TIGR03847 family)
MSESFNITDADLITVGTVGEPGSRLFFLQVRAGMQVVNVKVEKRQVAALAEAVGELLQTLGRPGHLPDDLEPQFPDDVAWSVGNMQLGYDEALDRLVLTVEEFVPREVTEEELLAELIGISDDDPDDDPDDEDEEASDAPSGATLRVLATREQMAAIAIRGTQLVESGRPPCPLCGYPLDPAGHVCPRTNGHRPPRL